MQHMTPRRTPKPPDRKPSAMKPTARYRLTPEWRPRLAERVEGDGTTMAPFLERTLTRDLAIDRQEPVRTSVRGAVVKADGCVVWLNGAFGVGKTTVGLALAAGLPDARIVDPEQIGRRLRQALPVALRTPELLLTHVPLRDVPEGCVNVHGHLHKWVPSGTRHINVAVEQTRYRPRSLTAVRRLAASLVRGERVPGRTTAQQLTHAGRAVAAGGVARD